MFPLGSKGKNMLIFLICQSRINYQYHTTSFLSDLISENLCVTFYWSFLKKRINLSWSGNFPSQEKSLNI